MTGMITVNGVRYRPEDAKRLGLVPDKPAPEEKQAPAPKNKARVAENKGASDN